MPLWTALIMNLVAWTHFAFLLGFPFFTENSFKELLPQDVWFCSVPALWLQRPCLRVWAWCERVSPQILSEPQFPCLHEKDNRSPLAYRATVRNKGRDPCKALSTVSGTVLTNVDHCHQCFSQRHTLSTQWFNHIMGSWEVIRGLMFGQKVRKVDST